MPSTSAEHSVWRTGQHGAWEIEPQVFMQEFQRGGSGITKINESAQTRNASAHTAQNTSAMETSTTFVPQAEAASKPTPAASPPLGEPNGWTGHALVVDDNSVGKAKISTSQLLSDSIDHWNKAQRHTWEGSAY